MEVYFSFLYKFHKLLSSCNLPLRQNTSLSAGTASSSDTCFSSKSLRWDESGAYKCSSVGRAIAQSQESTYSAYADLYLMNGIMSNKSIPAEEIHGDSWSAKYGHVLWPTPTLERPVRRGRIGLGETQVRSTKGLRQPP